MIGSNPLYLSKYFLLYLEEIVDELEDIPDKAIEVSHFLMGASAVSSSIKVGKFQKIFFCFLNFAKYERKIFLVSAFKKVN